ILVQITKVTSGDGYAQRTETNLFVDARRQVITDRNFPDRDPGVVEGRIFTDTAGPLAQVAIISISGDRCHQLCLYGVCIAHAADIDAVDHDTVVENAIRDDAVVVRTGCVSVSDTARSGVAAMKRILEGAACGAVLVAGRGHQTAVLGIDLNAQVETLKSERLCRAAQPVLHDRAQLLGAAVIVLATQERIVSAGSPIGSEAQHFLARSGAVLSVIDRIAISRYDGTIGLAGLGHRLLVRAECQFQLVRFDAGGKADDLVPVAGEIDGGIPGKIP